MIENMNLELLKKDRLYDGKSLIWGNGMLRQISDSSDSSKLHEGRFGEFPYKIIKTNMGVCLQIPEVKSNLSLCRAAALINDENIYLAVTKERILRLERTVVHEAKAEDGNLRKTDDKEEEYEGFIDSGDNGVMAGRIIFLDGKDHTMYKFIYAGTGNYTDIKMEYEIILKRLRRSVMR